MLITRDLTFSYNRLADPMHFPDLACAKGEVLLVLGKSGAGKTTLLSMLAGLLHPQSGSITIDGVDTSGLSNSRWDKFRGQHIGIIFQHPHFINALNAEQNLLLARQFANSQGNKAMIKELLTRLGISHISKNRPATLSQGEKQRLGIARALVNQPVLILADEPTSALDDENCMEVAELLKKQVTQNDASLIIVTHDKRLKDMFPKRVGL